MDTKSIIFPLMGLFSGILCATGVAAGTTTMDTDTKSIVFPVVSVLFSMLCATVDHFSRRRRALQTVQAQPQSVVQGGASPPRTQAQAPNNEDDSKERLAEIAKLKAEIRKLQKEAKANAKLSEDEREDYLTEISDLKTDIRGLELEKEHLKKNGNAVLEKRLRELQGRLQKAIKELDEARKPDEYHIEQIRDLNKELEEKDRLHETAAADTARVLAESESKGQKLSADLQQEVEDHAGTRGALDSSNAEVTKLQEEAVATKEQAEADEAAKQRELEQEQQAHQKTLERIGRRDASIKKLNADIAELQRQLDAAKQSSQGNVDEEKRLHQETRDELASRNTEIAELREQVSSLQTELANEKQARKDELAEERRAHGSTRSDLASANEHITKLNKAGTELENELATERQARQNEVAEEKRAHQETRDEVAKQVSTLQTDYLAEQQTWKTAFAEEGRKYQQLQQEANNALTTANGEVETLRQTTEAHAKRILELEAELAEVKDDAEATKDAGFDIQDELEAAEEKLKRCICGQGSIKPSESEIEQSQSERIATLEAELQLQKDSNTALENEAADAEEAREAAEERLRRCVCGKGSTNPSGTKTDEGTDDESSDSDPEEEPSQQGGQPSGFGDPRAPDQSGTEQQQEQTGRPFTLDFGNTAASQHDSAQQESTQGPQTNIFAFNRLTTGLSAPSIQPPSVPYGGPTSWLSNTTGQRASSGQPERSRPSDGSQQNGQQQQQHQAPQSDFNPGNTTGAVSSDAAIPSQPIAFGSGNTTTSTFGAGFTFGRPNTTTTTTSIPSGAPSGGSRGGRPMGRQAAAMGDPMTDERHILGAIKGFGGFLQGLAPASNSESPATEQATEETEEMEDVQGGQTAPPQQPIDGASPDYQPYDQRCPEHNLPFIQGSCPMSTCMAAYTAAQPSSTTNGNTNKMIFDQPVTGSRPAQAQYGPCPDCGRFRTGPLCDNPSCPSQKGLGQNDTATPQPTNNAGAQSDQDRDMEDEPPADTQQTCSDCGWPKNGILCENFNCPSNEFFDTVDDTGIPSPVSLPGDGFQAEQGEETGSGFEANSAERSDTTSDGHNDRPSTEQPSSNHTAEEPTASSSSTAANSGQTSSLPSVQRITECIGVHGTPRRQLEQNFAREINGQSEAFWNLVSSIPGIEFAGNNGHSIHYYPPSTQPPAGSSADTTNGATAQSASQAQGPITPDEIRAAIPDRGIDFKALRDRFQSHPKYEKTKFWTMTKQVATLKGTWVTRK